MWGQPHSAAGRLCPGPNKWVVNPDSSDPKQKNIDFFHISMPHFCPLLGMRSCLLTIEPPSSSTWSIPRCLVPSPWWPIALPLPPWPRCPATSITSAGSGASSQGWHQLCPSLLWLSSFPHSQSKLHTWQGSSLQARSGDTGKARSTLLFTYMRPYYR